MCVCCVCVFLPIYSGRQACGRIPAGVTQEEGHTGFLIHLPSAVLALILLARRIQPFLSFVDREVEFCVLTLFKSFSPCWPFYFTFYSYFLFILRGKTPVTGIRTHVPTCQKVSRLPTEAPGRPGDYQVYTVLHYTVLRCLSQLFPC